MKKALLKSLLISTSLLIILYQIFGSFYEEYQGFWNAFFSEKLSPGTPFDNFYFLGYIGVSYLYSWLYEIVPQVQWMSYVHYFQLITSFAILLFIVESFLQKSLKDTYTLTLISVLLFMSIAPDNILLYVFARASYIMCGVSLLAIIVLFNDWESIKKRFDLYLFLNLFYIWGALTRSESALAILMLLFCFAVVWHNSLKKAILTTLSSSVFTILLVAGIMIDINTSDEFHKRVEPGIETQFTIRNNVIPIDEIKSYDDSVKYEAALRMFWGDPDIITIEYLESLVKDPSLKIFDSNQWTRTLLELNQSYNSFKYYSILILFLTFFTISILLKQGKNNQALLLLFYFIGFVILLLANSYFVKMRDRTVSPYLIIYFASVFILLIKTFQSKKYSLHVFICILILGSSIQLYETYYKSKELKNVLKLNKQILTQLEECCSHATVMPNPTAIGNLTLAFTPFEIFDFSKFDRFYFYEASIQSIIPPFYDYLKKECNCEVRNFSNFYRFVLDKNYSKKVYAISNEDRMEVGMLYLKTHHGLDINYKKVENVDLNENLAMDYYSRRKLYLYEMNLKDD
jgi:hypothetical protein